MQFHSHRRFRCKQVMCWLLAIWSEDHLSELIKICAVIEQLLTYMAVAIYLLEIGLLRSTIAML